MKKTALILLFALLFSCADSNKDDPAATPEPVYKKITLDPGVSHQEMLGFGAALTWYSDRLVNSANKDAIAQLLFDDLGTDIVRFQAWYYPNDYPNYKGTANMSYDNSATLLNTTGQIYNLMIGHDPDIKVLLSSWGPPSALKSNANPREGTLKKDVDGFMYDEFAQYWNDILDNMPFNPDFISIQNEPSYTNPGWTTCQWAATETSSLPGYDIAFDKVYEKIQGRAEPPVMIGPESANIESFAPFVEALKNKEHVGMYGYHPYNINSGTSQSQIDQGLATIKGYNNKPNIMTEFSDNLSWLNTAKFINNALTKANTSGYIYWKMVWAPPAAGGTNAAMISIDQGGSYTVTPFYYLMKHFSRNIDAGNKRIDVVSENPSLSVSGFLNPAGNQLTLVVVNGGSQATLELEVKDNVINEMKVIQSEEGSHYKSVDDIELDDPVSFPGQSITTITIGI